MSHRTRKARGSAAERELVHMFWDAGWAAFRAPASGAMNVELPDVIAGNAQRKVAIEAKLTKESKKYLTKKEIDELRYFSEKFGCEAWVGVKFLRKPWKFWSLEDLRETAASYVAALDDSKALSFGELIE
ncbi:MAG: Holliday junction resolvase Hjc [Candidatus Woesearchaeota archaeon]|nr:Holliday junction resolvase Hjc [Candidatus Woesearchaeota archaeon]